MKQSSFLSIRDQIFWLILTSVFYVTASASGNQSVNFQLIRSKVAEQYPEVLKARADLESSKELSRSSQGYLDFSISGSVNQISESYQQQYQSIFLNKSFAPLNLDFFAGYEKGTGIFKPYQLDEQTSYRGANVLGFDLSILRYGLIDERRVANEFAQLNETLSRMQYLQKVVSSQTDATTKFLDWIFSRERVRVRKNLVMLAEARENIISQQLKAGLASQFQLNEFRLAVLQRRGELLTAEADFLQVQQELNVYLGNSFSMNESTQYPELKLISFNYDLDSLISLALQRNIQIIENSIELKKIQQSKALAQNSTLPKLDFKLKYTDDLDHSITVGKDKELKSFLSFEIPIENNTASGKLRSLEQKEQAIMQSFNLIKTSLQAEVKGLDSQLQAALQRSLLAKEELKLADWLQKAEATKFKIGQSQQVFLNIREQDLARAELNYLQSLVTVYKLREKFRKLLADELWAE